MAESTRSNIEQHPDIMALRARSEAAMANPGAQAAEGVGLLTGLYIAASPWIVGFSANTPLAISNLIVGLAFMFMLVGFGSAFERTHGMSWAAVGIGVWTIVAPWVVAGPAAVGGTILSNVIAGGVGILMALAITGIGMAKTKR
ncbi:SPW repeat protein [Streptomonospora litoralis]|uniref:SPW repeat protein n=1 Tax=Streptomonospora litoralis TaxID=2498135 RepID=A0A4P6Q1I8_9ACTN|nr:SPW repeat protein [Streptomonospora litoralis]QBI54448.1 SPW repeat protein [Streptomonospora litoralis]